MDIEGHDLQTMSQEITYHTGMENRICPFFRFFFCFFLGFLNGKKFKKKVFKDFLLFKKLEKSGFPSLHGIVLGKKTAIK